MGKEAKNQHFTITVKYHTSDGKKVCASIRCGCGNNYIINQKSNSWLISNWLQHYQSCTYDNNEQGRQDTLAHYFQPAAQKESTDAETIPLTQNPSFFYNSATNITALQLCQPILTNPYYHPFSYNQMANFQSHADVPPQPRYINSSISLNLSPGNSRHQSQFVTSL